ncbi:class I SAM-dependent methyltransferase [Pseudovibrio brasiliensis]|uniref:Class I SAM-dependent methyltransferase n=2 Tax=Pseudovibrio brasiliensis TaxID=1898042 RepID=A0ABX8ANX6_9HYPH|nr:class I SAM-dependent methyltransferase [Pseudovibrio brasiliensis]QUS55952.1 class I SAM-dependent methyltransferase [Pseudovibrio brasiliensis]
MTSSSSLTNSKAVSEIFEIGDKIDLSNCHYGPPTGGPWVRFIDRPLQYYSFLAGLSKKIGAKSIFEVGTHFGGSTKSFLAGAQAANISNIKITTIDTNRLALSQLSDNPKIQFVCGNATNPASIISALSFLESKEIDIIFIDALKSSEFICEVFFQLYSQEISPRYILLDDVSANSSMLELWHRLNTTLPGKAQLISKSPSDTTITNSDMALIDVTHENAEILHRLSQLSGSGKRTRIGNITSDFEDGHSPITIGQVFSSHDAVDFPAIIDEKFDKIRPNDAKAIYNLCRYFFRGFGKIVTIHDDTPQLSTLAKSGIDANLNFNHEKNFRVLSVVAPKFSINFEIDNSFLSEANVFDIDADRFRWIGDDIEIAILGSFSNQKQFANGLSEILAHSVPGQSFLLIRDIFVHYRLWEIITLAILSDNISICASDGKSVVIKVESLIDSKCFQKLATYDFSIEEQDSALWELATKVKDDRTKLDILIQLAWLRFRSGNVLLSQELIKSIKEQLKKKPARLREQKLERLRATISQPLNRNDKY